MTPMQERAALQAAKKLSMIGIKLNEHGAIDLCNGFLVEIEKINSEFKDESKIVLAHSEK
jgi:hypothetical protein